MNKVITESYNALYAIYSGRTYLSQTLNNVDREVMPEVTKIIYGVLENNVKYDYYISKLVMERPSSKLKIVFKLAMYILEHMDSIPDYAVINECVELTAEIGKKQLKGFVNATLKQFLVKKTELPNNRHEKISVECSMPLWLVKAYCKQYGEDTAVKLMTAKLDEREHIRANLRKITHNDLARLLNERGIEFSESLDGLGYYVRNSRNVRDLFDLGLITVQSLSSMLVVRALSPKSNSTVLDLCSAPGGKAVFMSETADNLEIIANELHPHRAELINSYIERMDAKGITVTVGDASQINEDYKERFDYVLCDAPCSGLGVISKKPDILLNKSYDDILNLSELQYTLLNNAIDYLKPDGVVVYSTCTTLREENYNVVGRTLKERDDVALEVMDISFENNGSVQLLPTDGMDGFFIARLRKISNKTER